MRLTKFTHACVRIEDGANTLVIDPGVFSEPESLAGADAVLVTHAHPDHLDVDKLSAAVRADPGLRIFTHADVVGELDAAATAVAPGDSFEAAGFRVRAVGGRHAEVYEGFPDCANVGFIVDTPSGALYHPGDSLHLPDTPVDTLLLPAAAPWLKLAEALDFARAVAPRRIHPVHDAYLSELGWGIVDSWFDEESRAGYHRIPIGGFVEL